LFLEIVFLFWGEQRSCDGWRGAQRPVGGNEPKKTGARSARARTRGQNPLVINNILMISLYFHNRMVSTSLQAFSATSIKKTHFCLQITFPNEKKICCMWCIWFEELKEK
jgi:hypothetical protein